MFKRILFVPMLLAAGGVPYVAMHENVRNSISGVWNSATAKSDEKDVDVQTTALSNGHSLENMTAETDIRGWQVTSATELTFTPPVADLRDAFRLDITPNWVKSRWPRVSAAVWEDRMEGLRVPLVTGTTTTDLVGSLTYFFNEHHQVQRIHFQGSTGDASRIIQLVVGDYQFKAVPTHNAGLYIRDYNGKPSSALYISHPAVIRADQPNHQLNVQLEINNPSGAFQISSRFASLLDQDKNSGRW